MIKRRSTINLLIIIVLGLCPLLWFKSGFLIKSEDIGIPLNYGEWTNYLFSWFGQRATGIYPVDNFAAIFFLSLPAVLQKAGLSIIASQKIQFIFWFMLSGFSIYYLIVALNKGKHPNSLIVLPAVVFYMFNLYLEPVWLGFNIANLSAYVGIPFLAGLVINAINSKRYFKYLSLAGLLGIILSGVGVNPPIMYVAVLFMVLWLAYCFIIHVIKIKTVTPARFITFVLFLVLIVTLVNAFWIYPQAKRLLHSTELKPLTEYKETVEEGIKERSKHTSLLNVSRFQAAWTWYEDYEDDPYVLYSEFYKKNKFFILLSIIPVIIVFLSCFNLKGQVYLPFYILLSLAGIIFATGIHAPFSTLNTFLVKYIPGFWMIRSPWYKWSLFTVLGFSVCIYYLAKKVFSLWPKQKLTFSFLSVFVSVLFLIYAFPIASGRMFTSEEERHYIPPQHIKIPAYVFEAAQWFNNQKDFYRIMLLHSNARRITDWGYSGYEPVLSYFTHKPLIVPIAADSYGSPYSIPKFKNLLYRWLYIDKEGKSERESLVNVKRQNSDKVAISILPMFNIKYLLYEGDIRWSFYDHYESPEFIEAKLALQKGVNLVKKFGKWKIYEIDKKLDHIYAASKINILDGDLEMLEALSRTNLLNYNNVFAHDIDDSFFVYIKKLNLIDKTFFYNRVNFDNETRKNSYTLLSTKDADIFSIKDVPDAAAGRNIEMKFNKDTYELYQINERNYYSFKADGSALEAEIVNNGNSDTLINLRLNCLNGSDKFIDVYLNDCLIKRIFVEKSENNDIKLESLNIKSGHNYITFSAPRSEDNSITAFASNINYYCYEFITSLNFAKNGNYLVELYTFPVNQVEDLDKSKEFYVNDNVLRLDYNESNTAYTSTKKAKFYRGKNVIRFLRQKQEDYYVLIRPLSSPQDNEFFELKFHFLNPVEYEVEFDGIDAECLFLFFNEAYDSNWIAADRQTNNVIINHFTANGYANGWLLNELQNNGQTKYVMLKYKIQDQFYAGLRISSPIIIICFIGTVVIFFSGLNNKRKRF